MDWAIVIPSYNRVDTLKEKTLSVLQSYKIPKSKIYVFVADKEQEALYKEGVGDLVGHIEVGVKGLAEVRNHIFKFFPKGKKLVFMDDDIRGLIEFDASQKRKERPLRSLEKVIDRGFEECEKAGARLWGVYPSPNGFFMKDTVTTDLRFIIGSFWGCMNPGSSSDMQLKLGSEKEDYQRTLQFWEADGVVVRLNFVSPKTAYYKEPGGMQEGGVNTRVEKQRKTVKSMLKRWPQYIKMNPRRKSGYPEILLVKPKNMTRKKK
jgi:cellulose synthase/poly-beta-1,6-N-acetylglucosamine synthase-like glycosyltransferase